MVSVPLPTCATKYSREHNAIELKTQEDILSKCPSPQIPKPRISSPKECFKNLMGGRERWEKQTRQAKTITRVAKMKDGRLLTFAELRWTIALITLLAECVFRMYSDIFNRTLCCFPTVLSKKSHMMYCIKCPSLTALELQCCRKGKIPAGRNRLHISVRRSEN